MATSRTIKKAGKTVGTVLGKIETVIKKRTQKAKTTLS